MKSFPLSLCLFGFFLTNATAQDPTNYLKESIYHTAFNGIAAEGLPSTFVNAPSASGKVGGSGYLDESFKNGKILDLNDQVFNISARYNVQADEFEILSDGQVKAMVMGKYKAVALEDKIFIPKAFVDKDGNKSTGNFELLVEGDLNLYLRRESKVFYVNNNISPGIGVTDPVKLTILESFYVGQPGQSITEILKGKKNILKLLSKKKKAVEQYAKQYNLSYRSNDGLRAIFSYYNSLLK